MDATATENENKIKSSNSTPWKIIQMTEMTRQYIHELEPIIILLFNQAVTCLKPTFGPLKLIQLHIPTVTSPPLDFLTLNWLCLPLFRILVRNRKRKSKKCYHLRVKSSDVWVRCADLRVTVFNSPSYELEPTSYEFKFKGYEFKFTSHKFKSIS